MKKSIREEEIILQGIAEGKNQKEIGELLGGITASAVSKRLNEIDSNKVAKAKEQIQLREKEIILQGIAEGKSLEKIGKLLGGITRQAVYKKVNAMSPNEIKQAKKQAQIREEEIILQGIAEGKSLEEIGELLGVTHSTIGRKIREIDYNAIEQAKEQARIIKGKIISFDEIKEKNNKKPAKSVIAESSIETEESKDEKTEAKTKSNAPKSQYTRMKQKLADRTITKEEIIQYRKRLEYATNIQQKEIELMIEIYIKTKQTRNAINFLNSLITNEDIKSISKQKLKDMKQHVEIVQNKQSVREYLNSGMYSCSDIAHLIGVSEIFVVQVKKEMEAKKYKGQEK